MYFHELCPACLHDTNLQNVRNCKVMLRVTPSCAKMGYIVKSQLSFLSGEKKLGYYSFKDIISHCTCLKCNLISNWYMDALISLQQVLVARKIS